MGRLTFSVPELCDLLHDPRACEQVSAAAGTGPLVVEVRTGRDREQLDRASAAGQPLGTMPGAALAVVVVAVVHEAAWAGSAAFADVVLAGDPEPALGSIRSTVSANPKAATALAMLLRAAPARPGPVHSAQVMSGLAAESATFSMLQGGPEFQRWRAAHPPRRDPSTGERLRVTRRGDLLELTLARADRRNALDAAMRDALVEALMTAVCAPALRIRWTGEGPAFCAGGDLDEFGSSSDPAQAHLVRVARSPGWLLHQLSARAEVRLHGACLGSGIELPAFAGRVVATPDVLIGLPEIALGLIPGAGGTVSLPRRIGRHRTARLALSGEHIDAATALSWGLVDAIEDDRPTASIAPR